MLDRTDFTTNPAAPELGSLGVCQVRFGKAMRGSPPRRRAVASVLPWAVEALAEYLAEVRPRLECASAAAMWPTERGGPDLDSLGRRPVRALPGGGRTTGRTFGALPAALLCLPLDRRWGRPPVRAAAGGALLGVDDGRLHHGRRGRQEPDAALGAGARVRRRRTCGDRRRTPGGAVMPVAVGYHWHLRRLMAEAGMFATTDLVPLLADRGVRLSREQVYRLVVRVPERLNLTTLAALCDILDCSPAQLIEPHAGTSAAARRDASGSAPPARPRRARLPPP